MSEMYKLKFESLVSEYGKLLSHLKVLKKGYTDSQAKLSDLTELVKQKDKSLRKNEIEIESLNFRNQQLTKRISVLQSDLDCFEKTVSKKSQEKTRSNTDAVLQEELHKRILENSNLACQLEDIQHELRQCKEMLDNTEKSHFETEMKYKCDISRLKHQNQTQKMSLILQTSSEGDGCLTPSSCSDGGIKYDSTLLNDEKNIFGLNDFFLSSDDIQIQKKLKKYEQENRRLKMEFEVLKMENESLKIANKRQNVIQTEGRQRCDSSEDELWEHPVWNKEGVLTSYVGKLSVPFKIDDEIRKREENIIKFFRKEISRIIVEKQQSDSLIDLYAAECEALTLRSSWSDIENQISTER